MLHICNTSRRTSVCFGAYRLQMRPSHALWLNKCAVYILASSEDDLIKKYAAICYTYYPHTRNARTKIVRNCFVLKPRYIQGDSINSRICKRTWIGVNIEKLHLISTVLEQGPKILRSQCTILNVIYVFFTQSVWHEIKKNSNVSHVFIMSNWTVA